MPSPALFIDRDGTLVLPRHYPCRPEDLQIYHGLGFGLRRLQAAGWRVVIITNQSGVARGYLGEEDLEAMHTYLERRLDALDVRLDGAYYCPHHPQGVVQGYSLACDCRKPAPGLLLRAAADLDIDLASSWCVGDTLDDVEAGNRAGCRTVLVDLGAEGPPERPIREPTAVARSTRQALAIVAMLSGLQAVAELSYRPLRWELPAPSGALYVRSLGETMV